MTSETVRIEGLKELEFALRKFAPMLKGNPLRTAVRAMTVPVIERMVESAKRVDNPETPGDISRTITKRLTPIKERDKALARGDSAEGYEVGPHKKDKGGVKGAWYAHFVEFGTAKGQVARPFVRPAFEAARADAEKAFKDKMGKLMETARKRLVK